MYPFFFWILRADKPERPESSSWPPFTSEDPKFFDRIPKMFLEIFCIFLLGVNMQFLGNMMKLWFSSYLWCQMSIITESRSLNEDSHGDATSHERRRWFGSENRSHQGVMAMVNPRSKPALGNSWKEMEDFRCLSTQHRAWDLKCWFFSHQIQGFGHPEADLCRCMLKWALIHSCPGQTNME